MTENVNSSFFFKGHRIFDLSWFLILFILILSCSAEKNYSGTFKRVSGNCSSEYIELKKVQGFGDKYYLVTIIKMNRGVRSKTEFLGVIKNNIITIYSGTRLHDQNLTVQGTLTFNGRQMTVVASDKHCTYNKTK